MDKRGEQMSKSFEEKTLNATVPKDRIGVLIGPRGSVKTQIENKLQVELGIDSSTGSVKITLSEAQDPSLLLRARDTITAIARGFSPKRAFRLFSEDVFFKLIDLSSMVGKNPKDLKRIKARIIGEKGKTRKIIEETSGCFVSVYGDTTSIIGRADDIEVAGEAIAMLTEGALHSRVYRYLDNYAHKKKTKAFLSEYGGETLRP